MRWFAVRETRVVESDDLVNYRYVDGRLESILPEEATPAKRVLTSLGCVPCGVFCFDVMTTPDEALARIVDASNVSFDPKPLFEVRGPNASEGWTAALAELRRTPHLEGGPS